MKDRIFKGLLACSAVMLMAGCSENSWNEDHLNGFDSETLGKPSGTTTAEYTLATADYAAISKNSTNVDIANEAGQSNALKALASNEYFTPAIPAKEYLPAYMQSSSFPYFLANDGSLINVTYNQISGVTEEYTALTNARQYTVTTDNYKSAWGSDEDYIEAFAPMTSAANKLPAILASSLTDPVKGQYALVTYKQAQENPIFGDVEGGDETVLDFTKLSNNDVVTFKGQIAANSNYGPVVATKGGNGFIFANKGITWSDYAIGDEVTVEAKVYNYYGALEFTNPTITKGANSAIKYPAPTEWGAADVQSFMDEVTAAKSGSPIPARYIKFTGKLTIGSGKYYNFYIGDQKKYVGLYQPTANQKAGLVDGNTYTLTGYAITTGTGGVNFIPTHIDGKEVAPFSSAAAVSRAAANTPVTESVTAVYQYNGSAWEVADGVAALSAGDYTAMGFAAGSLSDPEIYLPLFMKNKYPYALPGDIIYVVYNGTKVSQLDYDGTAWTVNTDNLATVTTQWKKEKAGWVFVKTVGVAIFNLVETDLLANHKYLMVADGICAIPLDASKNYGYLYTAAVPGGVTLELASDVNAFEFTTTYTNEGTSLTCPEGKFLIKDNNGRYLYMQGTYNSFNVTATPVVDGALNPSAMFTATANGDGTWKIATEVSGSEKWIQYSTNYGSWGCYPNVSGIDPTLYMLAE